MKLDFFQNSLKTNEAEEKTAKSYSSRIVLLRFITFCFIIFFAAAGYDYTPAFYGAAIFLLLIFSRLLQKHQKIKNKMHLLQCRKQILLQYIARFTTDWYAFPETGSRYLTEAMPQGKDLDLFGKASIYQYICAARTALGRKKLADALSPQPPDAAIIKKRQKAAAELIANPALTIELQSLSCLLPNHHDTDELMNQLETSGSYISRFMQLTTYGLPALTLSSLLLAYLDKISWNIALLFMALQFLLSGLLYQHSTNVLRPLFQTHHILKPYQKLFAVLEKENFKSPYLRELQLQLQTDSGAAHAIHYLYLLSEYTNMRLNLFFSFIANTLILWDFQCCLKFSLWKHHKSENVRLWLDTFAEIELLMSLAIIGQVKETYIFPQLLNTTAPLLDATEVKHVLLPEDSAIANSILAHSETCIVTGSNMSGKTTFLRTLAASAILSYAGAPVCARSFSLSRMHIFTSMRVQDDITKGLSTFYAELLRIKQMVEFSRKGIPMFTLIDEIFKGTNSADRIIGAREAIIKLTNPWSLNFVSTHDFELCNMADKQNLSITNYHFSEYYTNDEIHFDYKIKPGRCQTTNAKYLLKLAGIL
jgi:hypothetical protein